MAREGKQIRRDVRRRLDQFIANPKCEANVLSAVHDIPMLEVARREGCDPIVGQSPFAIIRGLKFEQGLFDEDAARLRAGLVQAGVLPPSARGFRDFRISSSRGPMADVWAAREATKKLLIELAAGLADPPAILASPTILIPGKSVLPHGLFAMDVLAVQPRATSTLLQVGEIKIYPDRGGYTDPQQLATARAQAGLYVYGLRRVIAEELKLQDRLEVAHTGFLVLTQPGSNEPSIRAHEDLEWQARRAELCFDRLLAAAAREAELGEADQRLSVVQAAPVHYEEGCVNFCERAESCRKQAEERGDSNILGAGVAQLLGALTLPRAVALLNGAAPEDEAEADFLTRLRELDPWFGAKEVA